MFAYSDRERTHAARHYVDDVAPDAKKRRLAEALEVFRAGVTAKRKGLVGSRQLVRLGAHCSVLLWHAWMCLVVACTRTTDCSFGRVAWCSW